MKNAITIILILIGFSTIVGQPTGSLLFDGIDDYATVVIGKDMPGLNSQNQSFRAIFRANVSNGMMTIASQDISSSSTLSIGLDSLGALFIKSGNHKVITDGMSLADGQCHEVVVSFDNGDINVHLDKVKSVRLQRS